MRFALVVILAGVAALGMHGALLTREPAQQKGLNDWTPVQQAMVGHLDSLKAQLVAVNQDIWNHAELGLEEYRSAARLVGVLVGASFLPG